MKETGTAPTPLELFRRTHQRKDNTWVDRRSQHVNVMNSHLYNLVFVYGIVLFLLIRLILVMLGGICTHIETYDQKSIGRRKTFTK